MSIKLRIVSIAASLLFVFSVAWVVAAPAPWWQLLTGEPVRTGTDPLSPAEISRVQQLAVRDAAVSAQVSSAGRSEVLLVERHQETKDVRQQGAWSRRADMYVYDYDTDTLAHALVNLDSGVVERLDIAQQVQLPLTEQETGFAIQLALAEPKTRALIEAEYTKITGQPLLAPTSQLNIHALIFRFDTMPDRAPQNTAACGLHRCAQLILATHSDFLINVLPIVDLSRQQVLAANVLEQAH